MDLQFVWFIRIANPYAQQFKKMSFSPSHRKNAKIATIVDNQQQKRNDSNKTMHKKTKNDKQNNLPRRRTKMRQANERRR